MLVFKSFDPLRVYRLTLGRQARDAISNAVIIGRPRETFLLLWIETYRTFSQTDWSFYSTRVPNMLARLYPSLVHVDNRKLIRPSWTNRKLLFEVGYQLHWAEQFSCHVWTKAGRVPAAPEDLRNVNTTIGYMMKYIYIGKSNN